MEIILLAVIHAKRQKQKLWEKSGSASAAGSRRVLQVGKPEGLHCPYGCGAVSLALASGMR